jgi:hypothetical protein
LSWGSEEVWLWGGRGRRAGGFDFGHLVGDAGFSDSKIFGAQLAADEAEAFADGGFSGAARAHEGVQDDAAGWGDQAHQVGH